MIIGQDKPSLEDLVQYGVPGMKWGKRKPLTDKQKKIAKISIGVAVATGAIVAAAILARNGKTKLKPQTIVNAKKAYSSPLAESIAKMSMADVRAHSNAYWKENAELAAKLGIHV